MKTLRNYIDEAQTKAFNDNGAFFAFSQKQLDEAKKPDVETYVSLGAGLICPKENAKKLSDELAAIHKKGIAEDIAENGKDKIIERELANYECFYTGDISDCIDALADYEISGADIMAVFHKVKQNYDC